MNIFVTSECPIKSAQYLDDKRVIKMILESAQIMSTVAHMYGAEGGYRPTHRNHPVVIWAGKSKGNYLWLFYHYVALCQEYTRRFGKKHKAGLLEGYLFEQLQLVPPGQQTEFVNCARNKRLGIDYTFIPSVTAAYRQYLRDRWATDKRKPVWSEINND